MLSLTKMKVKTKSGVSITIIPEGSSKIMLFDKPVRVVELKEEETTQISSLLSNHLHLTKAERSPKQVLSEGR